MKKLVFYAALPAALFLFSCQKQADTAHHEESSTAARARSMNEPNGGGPYVLNMTIQLSGDQEVPAAMTNAKGVAHLRVTADRKLYSKIIVTNMAEGDALRFAHVHAGAAGANGPVVITLAHNAAEFGQNMVMNLTPAQYNLLVSGAAYVNAHSNFHPAGIVRGQIR
jgi:hypothetical protein